MLLVGDGYLCLVYRINCLVAIFFLQAWVMWNFITFHLRRVRERNEAAAVVANKKLASPGSSQKRKKAKGLGGIFYSHFEDGDLL